MNTNPLFFFFFCMDTAPVSQRTPNYNPEIHPKEPLLGKQAKNSCQGSSASSEAVLRSWGRPRSLLVMDSNFQIWSCFGRWSRPPAPQSRPLGRLWDAPWASGLGLGCLWVARGALWQVGPHSWSHCPVGPGLPLPPRGPGPLSWPGCLAAPPRESTWPGGPRPPLRISVCRTLCSVLHIRSLATFSSRQVPCSG